MSNQDTVAHPTVLDHLLELRTRLLIVLAVFIITSGAGFFLYDRIFAILVKSINMQLFYTSPTGAIDFAIQLSFYVGFFFTLPVISYQLFRFVKPAFPDLKYGKVMVTYGLLSLILCVGGVLYAYFFSLPATMQFLKLLSPHDLKPIISAQEYLSFALAYIASFAMLFQVPLILLACNHFKQLSIKKLLAWEPYLIAISFVVAGVITPTTDAFNQILLAVPPIILYQLSLILVVMVNSAKKSSAERALAASARVPRRKKYTARRSTAT